MKYMGSKRWMLGNGLGDVLDRKTSKARRFVDLFAGSGAVACHVATRRDVPVLANDLQAFSAVLSGAVLGRTAPVPPEAVWSSWKARAIRRMGKTRLPSATEITQKNVKLMRAWCSEQSLTITRAYGAHYFSPLQSLWIDAFLGTLPPKDPYRNLALAALLEAASQCVASPGHTAQPFQVTRSAKPFLIDAWRRDVPHYIYAALTKLSARAAKQKGEVSTMDALVVAETLGVGDLVFIDPPYSGVHYSRFYHVLETIATGNAGAVSGVGRYPESSLRPSSDFSICSKSATALDKLLSEIARNKATAVVTFPAHECSNGLSGAMVRNIAQKYFSVSEQVVHSKFSTLGGNKRMSKTNNKRAARQPAKELILSLERK